MNEIRDVIVNPYEAPYDLILNGVSPNKYKIVITNGQSSVEIGEITRYSYTCYNFAIISSIIEIIFLLFLKRCWQNWNRILYLSL